MIPRSVAMWVLGILLWSATLWAETGLLLRDSCASIVAPAAGKTWCFDRTTNRLNKWNGNAWISATGQTLDALAFGVVVGDSAGNEAGNNTALTNFLAAMNSSPPIDGRLPCGIIRYTTPLTIGSAEFQKLNGCGGGIWDPGVSSPTTSTVLKFHGTGVALKIASRGFYGADFQVVDGIGTTSSNATAGIQITDAADIAGVVLDRITVAGFKKVGAAGLTTASASNDCGGGTRQCFITTSNFYNVQANNNYDGVLLRGYSPTTMRFFGGGFGSNARYGVNIEQCEGCEFYSNSFQSNTTHGMHIENTVGTVGNLTIHDPYFETIGTYDIYLKGPGTSVSARTRDVHVYNPKWSGNAKFYVENATNVMVHGSNFASTYTDADTSPFVKSGVNVGIAFLPRESAQATVGNLVANLQAFMPGRIRGLWIADQANSGAFLADYSGRASAHTVTTSLDCCTGTSNMQAWINTVPYSQLLNSTAYWETADHNDFSFGDAQKDEPFTILALVKPASFASTTIAAKWDDTAKREYEFGWDASSKLHCEPWDDSAGAKIGRSNNTADSGTNVWAVYACVYDGSGVNDGVKLYKNASRIDDTNTGSGTYTAMENLTAKLATYVTVSGARTRAFDGQVSTLLIVNEALSDAKINAITAQLLAYAGNLAAYNAGGAQTNTPYWEAKRILTKTGNYSIGANDDTLLVDATAGGITITLPALASGPQDGRVVQIKKIDSSTNAVTVDGNGAETIDGAATLVLTGQYDAATLQGEATEWRQIGGVRAFHTLTVGGGARITKILSAAATLDFPNSAASGCDDLTVTVTGAAVGDVVSVGPPNGSVPAESSFWGWVSATDTVTVRHCAHGTAGDPASGSYRVIVTKF